MLHRHIAPDNTDTHFSTTASQTNINEGSLISPSSAQGPQPSTDMTENVHVAVRCRPLSYDERSYQTEKAWHVDPFRRKVQLTDSATTTRPSLQQEIHSQTNRSKNKVYHFDTVGYGSDNTGLYETSVKPLIGHAMDGYNDDGKRDNDCHAAYFLLWLTCLLLSICVMQMGTDYEPGIIQQAVNEIFSHIQKTANYEFLLRVSYMEIYNETIRDLLAPETTDIKIREAKQHGVYVTPLKEHVVTCPQDVLDVIQHSEGNRHISTTDYNLHSSRSHTIFQMIIESHQRSNDTDTDYTAKQLVKISQLNLIDLAGSEKAASDRARRKEGAYINKSLLTLGTVISKLADKSVGHVPYRDSKLTRILQPSLSGHAKVVVICTISPAMSAVDESINTLKFAARVKKIVLAPKNDAVMDDKALLQQYRGEIMDLKCKLQVANDVLLKEQESNQFMITAERNQYEETMALMQKNGKALEERIGYLTNLILSSGSNTIPPTLPPPIDSACMKQEERTTIPHTVLTQVKQEEYTMAPQTHRPLHRPNSTIASQANNPWILIKDLRQQNNELRLDKHHLQAQLDHQGKLNQDLLGQVADMQVQLNVFKDELQITSWLPPKDMMFLSPNEEEMPLFWDEPML
ncbi:hypothetical protein [Absidia glauca]|uniref:Kinesin-like protein n=1 Tax=Absidia glauca TaxID=4829 RepID=A0A168KRH8_ABSGL|nr:hypothetical protein [Absidia glauca]